MTTTLRNVRIDDALWTEAGAYAAAKGTNLSEVIRAALEAYRVQARLQEPMIKALAKRIGAQWPVAKPEEVQDAIQHGAAAFGLDLGHLDAEGEDAIVAYAGGWLGAQR
jgi:type II secretory pathway component PulM